MGPAAKPGMAERVTIYSCRFGGPLAQHRLLKEYLTGRGYEVRLRHTVPATLLSMLFERKDIIISLLPLPFRFGARRYILNVHGDFRKERHLVRNPLAFLYPLAVRVADAVVVQSRFLKGLLELDDAIVIPNGVVPDEGRKKPHDGLSHGGPLRFVTVTNFSFKDKAEGVLTLVRALRGPEGEVAYDIFGDGTFLRHVRERLSRMRLASGVRVALRGFSHNIPGELAHADLFLYWSSHDNMPMAVLEAMAAGLPVVTNDVGAMREIITSEKEGFIVNRKTLPAVLARLRRDAGLRRRVGRAGRKAVLRRLSMDRIGAAWERLFNRHQSDYRQSDYHQSDRHPRPRRRGS